MPVYNGMRLPDLHTLKDILDGFDAHVVGENLIKHMNATC